MKHPYDDNPIRMATHTTMATLLGTNNCFSVAIKPETEGEPPTELRIVNFKYEPLQELLKARIVWWPIMVMEIAPGIGIIHDPRIPRDKYENRYCTVCCPNHLLPPQQRAEQLRDIAAGFRTEHRRKNGIGVVSTKSRDLSRRTIFCWGKCPDNWLYHLDLVTDDDFEVTYWRANGPFDPEEQTPSTEDIVYSVADVGHDYRDAIRRAEKDHGGHTVSVDDPDPTMHAARRRKLFGDPPEAAEEPERRTLTAEEKKRYACAIGPEGLVIHPNIQQMPKAYAEKAVNPDYYQRIPLNDPTEEDDKTEGGSDSTNDEDSEVSNG